MASVTITTAIKQTIASNLQSSSEIKNLIESIDINNPLTVASDLVIDYSSIKTWILDNTSGPVFNEDIFDFLNIADPNEIRFLHIQCHKVTADNKNKITPILFRVTFDLNIIGNMSQLTLGNLRDLNIDALTISNVQIAADEKAILTLIVGIKQ